MSIVEQRAEGRRQIIEMTEGIVKEMVGKTPTEIDGPEWGADREGSFLVFHIGRRRVVIDVAEADIDDFPADGGVHERLEQAFWERLNAGVVAMKDWQPVLPKRDGGWWSTAKPTGLVCRACGAEGSDTVTVMAYCKDLDFGDEQARMHPGWAPNGWLVQRQCPACGDLDYYGTAQDAKVDQWGRSLGGWQPEKF